MENKKNTEVEMTQEEKNADIRKYEDDILGGLMAAASFKYDDDDMAEIEIVRKGAVVLKFRIRPLSEEEYLECRRECTVYKKERGSSVRKPDHLETAKYRCSLIYEATVEEDREKIWDNTAAWRKMNVPNGIAMIEVVLKAGEKDRIIEKLDEISGYMQTDEEVAKN